MFSITRTFLRLHMRISTSAARYFSTSSNAFSLRLHKRFTTALHPLFSYVRTRPFLIHRAVFIYGNIPSSSACALFFFANRTPYFKFITRIFLHSPEAIFQRRAFFYFAHFSYTRLRQFFYARISSIIIFLHQSHA